MPPWKAEPGPVRFEGERRLTPAEIATLRRWADAGAPEGNPAVLLPCRGSPKAGNSARRTWWRRCLNLLRSRPTVPDLYQCFVIPNAVAADRYARAMEFLPGNRKAVHHALVFADTSGEARKRAAGNPARTYPCFGVPGVPPSASLGGWTPGTEASVMPPGTGIALRKGADLVIQMHYHPTGRPESDQSSVAVYFRDKPPERTLFDVFLGSRNIDIPPGEPRYVVRDHFTLPVPVVMTGIIPHAHYICREMRGVAILPGGKRLPLIVIKDWDFNWQQQYRLEKRFVCPPTCAWRWSSCTTTPKATRAIPAYRRAASSGAATPPTRWQGCTFKWSRRTKRTHRNSAGRFGGRLCAWWADGFSRPPGSASWGGWLKRHVARPHPVVKPRISTRGCASVTAVTAKCSS